MADRTEGDSREFLVDVDSKIVKLEPPDDPRLRAAVASAGGELVRVEPPRFWVRVKASSESEAGERAVEALERWTSGPGAGWSATGVTQWEG